MKTLLCHALSTCAVRILKPALVGGCAALLLSGCASFTRTSVPVADVTLGSMPERADAAGINVSPRLQTLPVVLPQPEAREGTLLLAQQIRAELSAETLSDDVRTARDAALGERRTAQFEAYLTAGGESFRMTLMHSGFTVWELVLTGDTLTENRRPQLPKALKGEYLLRDIAYAYWPRAWLDGKLAPLGLMVSDEVSTSGERVRRIAAVGRSRAGASTSGAEGPTMFTVHYEDGATPETPDGRITIENAPEGYRLTIESRSVE